MRALLRELRRTHPGAVALVDRAGERPGHFEAKCRSIAQQSLKSAARNSPHLDLSQRPYAGGSVL